jgi:magnesium chelatase subunit D
MAPTSTGQITLKVRDLYCQKRLRRHHRLVVFVVDTSDSMGDGPLANMSAALGAAMAVARDTYLNRDMVSLVTFRGQDAQTLVPPTTSIHLLRQSLSRLPVGGATPLSAGLQQAKQVINQCCGKDPNLEVLLVLISDGEATVSEHPGNDPQQECLTTAQQLDRQQVTALIIDTRRGTSGPGFMQRLAKAFKVPCHHVQHLQADKVFELINIEQTGTAPAHREGQS